MVWFGFGNVRFANKSALKEEWVCIFDLHTRVNPKSWFSFSSQI